VVPASRGGWKKVPCCRKCNGLKADLDPTLWRWFTEMYPGWWKTFNTHKEVRAAIWYRRREPLDVAAE
jgi:hypothetical protein